MKEDKKIRLLKAFQMGMNCLIGSSSISVFDTTMDEARTTAHHFLLKVYSNDEKPIDVSEVLFVPGSHFTNCFTAAAYWFNEDDSAIMELYEQVEKSIQEHINREMTYYVTHGYNKRNGEYKIEESVSSIIHHYMVEYMERICSGKKLDWGVTAENLKKYTLGGE